ncbi:response regulator [Candidatus Woesearchaeota archaeon]|nr:MAG: response regulator [Candidatus Woesearchaeota archaeon]
MPKKKEILVVDDEPITVELLEDILSHAGFSVRKAYNGKECLSAVKKKMPDLILLDIMMPDMSGWDVFTRLQQEYKDKVKVIFVSAIEVSQERLEALKNHGLKDYITKPFEPDDLLQRVQKALE